MYVVLLRQGLLHLRSKTKRTSVEFALTDSILDLIIVAVPIDFGVSYMKLNQKKEKNIVYVPERNGMGADSRMRLDASVYRVYLTHYERNKFNLFCKLTLIPTNFLQIRTLCGGNADANTSVLARTIFHPLTFGFEQYPLKT